MSVRALDRALARLVQLGALEVIYPDGTARRYGDREAPARKVWLKSQSIVRRALIDPDMALGEGFVDGDIVFENDDLRGFLEFAQANRVRARGPLLLRWRQELAGPLQRYLPSNLAAASRRNVAHHYDLSGALYDLFLDADRQYSCAYFTDPDMSLEAAQEAKKHHIARKLRIRPGDRVLDIGCGWGGMALTLARDYGARVVGITLSDEQLAVATRRVAEAGLSDRIEIRKQDYRSVRDRFDRIVSIGMFEHVGRSQFDTYFARVSRLLEPHGVALIHTIGSTAPPMATSTWIRRYIFPGGYIPSMSEVLRSIEESGLRSLDIEVWRLHYARTLRHWHDRFMARIDEARAIYDDRFCRMWRYYLTSAEVGFTHERLVVFQFQLGHDREAVPLTRDYLCLTPGG